MDDEKLRATSLDELQEEINYHFHNLELLKQALTHKSFANEQQLETGIGNERLEFLGDAVLELVITHILMEKFPDSPEGKLSQLRAAIVNKEGLAALAQHFHLGRYVLLGRGEEATNGRTKKSISANVYEALIAAVYYDGGYEKVFQLIENHCAPLIDEVQEKGFYRDYKTRLQEYCQAKLGSVPEYLLLREDGPDHDKLFELHVVINGNTYATGSGKNKKAAEQDAARKTLAKLTGTEAD